MFSPPPTFTPIVEDLRLAHTHFSRLPGVGAAGTAHLQNFYQKFHLNDFSAHGSTFFSGAFSGSRGVARCRKWWCFAPGRVGSRTLPCKVVKVVFLEVFFCVCVLPLCFPPPVQTTPDPRTHIHTHSHHGEADSGETAVLDAERTRRFPG